MDNTIHILSTKIIGKGLLNTALDNGIFIDEKSFINIEDAMDKLSIDKIIQSLTAKLNVVFTSVNAVNVVSPFLLSKPDWSVYCIGDATKELVVKVFGEDSIAGTASNAKHLAEKIIANNAKSVLFFCGDQRRDELPDLLRNNRIGVEECVLYKTILTPSKVEKAYHGILFFSPTAVKSFFSVNTVTKDTCIFALGETTSSAVKNVVNNEVIIASNTNKESMIASVIKYYKLRKSNNAAIKE